jgi:hypothetical protein
LRVPLVVHAVNPVPDRNRIPKPRIPARGIPTNQSAAVWSFIVGAPLAGALIYGSTVFTGQNPGYPQGASLQINPVPFGRSCWGTPRGCPDLRVYGCHRPKPRIPARGIPTNSIPYTIHLSSCGPCFLLKPGFSRSNSHRRGFSAMYRRIRSISPWSRMTCS